MIKFFRKAALTLTFLPAVALSQGALENPASLTTESGVGIISGWHCTAREVEALVDNVSVGYTYVGSDRSDTKSVCGGVSATGFALLTNFNVFTPGLHNLKVLADGKQFGEVNFTTVKSGGVEYLTNVSKQAVISDFPAAGSTATLNWNQSKQSFVVTSVASNISTQGSIFASKSRLSCNREVTYIKQLIASFTINNNTSNIISKIETLLTFSASGLLLPITDRYQYSPAGGIVGPNASAQLSLGLSTYNDFSIAAYPFCDQGNFTVEITAAYDASGKKIDF